MRIGLVSGDGLPVSGLLTIARSVIALGVQAAAVDPPVIADLGYSWRPDKPRFFPTGPAETVYPSWLQVCPGPAVSPEETATRARELLAIRDEVARYEHLSAAQRARLRDRAQVVEDVYAGYFTAWLAEHDIDWVIAVNMTLSDAVPVTAGLARAVHDRYAAGRPGGIVYWDHDLFASCAIPDPHTGARLYPPVPNEMTPLPAANGYTRWAVVSEELAAETACYPTAVRPTVIPNILPAIPDTPLEPHHHAFATHHDLDPARPVLLAPVRVFRVKGVHLALEIHAAAATEARRTGQPVPYLLIFGDRAEEPDYGDELTAQTRTLGTAGDVRWLDGVPLSTHQDRAGRWHLDEIDLLRLAAARGGAVLFTPAVPDVETVGLGPGLAAAANLPALITPYDVFNDVYGRDFACLVAKTSSDGLRQAGRDLLDVLGQQRRADPALHTALEANRAAAGRIFPTTPWATLWDDLNHHVNPPPCPRSDPAAHTSGP